MSPIVWIFLLAAVLVVAGIIGAQQARRRRDALFQFATRLGLSFEPDPYDVHDQYEPMGFVPFGKGSSRQSSNLLYGSSAPKGNDPGPIVWEIFDYKYTTGSGKDRQTHRWGIVAARIPLVLPRLTIRPERFTDKLAAMVGFDDLNFESEEFSRKFFVRCDERQVCYELIHPKMMEFLLARGVREWQIAGTFMVLSRHGVYSAAEIEQCIGLIRQFLALTPQYVRQDRSLG